MFSEETIRSLVKREVDDKVREQRSWIVEQCHQAVSGNPSVRYIEEKRYEKEISKQVKALPKMVIVAFTFLKIISPDDKQF